MPIIPLSCPSCGGNLTVDSSLEAAICKFCGKPYIVKDAIVNNYINYSINTATIQADTINLSTQKDFDIKAGKLIKYLGEKQEVEIPDYVNEIAKCAFENMNIKSVSIPRGLSIIGERAFRGCTQLKAITIPDSVSYIGEYAFQDCINLSDVKLPMNYNFKEWQFSGTPFWNGRCPRCGGEKRKSDFLNRASGYKYQCKKCNLALKE